jgi:hypothetical protein
MRWLFSKWMFLSMVNCIFLLCLLLGVKWHHGYIFMLFVTMWQIQDANFYMIAFPRSWVDSYMISFPRPWIDHYMFIDTDYWNEIKSTRPWWRWWFDILWMTFTRLWPTYSCHVYFGLARSDTKWLFSKYFTGIPSAISLINLFCPLCVYWIVKPTLLDIKILMQLQFSCLAFERMWKVMASGNFCWSGIQVLKFTYCYMQSLDFGLIVYKPYWSSGWFYLWSSCEEFTSLNFHFLFSYPWRFKVYHSKTWS